MQIQDTAAQFSAAVSFKCESGRTELLRTTTQLMTPLDS